MSEPIPDPGSEFEEEGVPDHEGPLPEKTATGDPQEGVAPPAERPAHSDDYGVTLDEQREGATISRRLREEQSEQEVDVDPDVDPDQVSADPYPADEEERGGRIVADEEGASVDREKDSVGYDVGTDAGGFSSEERGMHVEPEEGEQ